MEANAAPKTSHVERRKDGVKTSHGERRQVASVQERTSAAQARPDTAAPGVLTEPAKTAEMNKTNPFDRTVMFAMSPRTYDQTLKGAPKEFKGAQEVDKGTYERDLFGRSVPGGWDHAPAISSRAAMLAKRRTDRIPSMTFDLDGDGCVSKEDYTISLRNDRDKDGRLDTPERAQALREVEAGKPAAKFAALRPITAPEWKRLDSNGWPLPAQTTAEANAGATRSALLAKRRGAMVRNNHEGYLKYEQALAKVRPPWTTSEQLAECQSKAAETLPPKKIRSVEMEALRQSQRQLAGLAATMTALNPMRNSLDPVAHVSGCCWHEEPGAASLLGYCQEPLHNTRSSLNQDRRSSRTNLLEETVRRCGPSFKNMRTRLEAREDAEFLMAQNALADPSNRVRSKLLETRRQDNVTELKSMWEKEPEAPMNDARKATPSSRIPFWTLKDTYEVQPKEQSNFQLSQTRKWFKHVPEKFMAPPPQIWGKGGPLDPYERPYTRKADKEDNMAVKITTQTTSVADMDPHLKGPYKPRAAPKPEIRTDDPKALASPCYLTDSAIESLARRDREIPLFSSFSADWVYMPQQLTHSLPAGGFARGVGGSRSSVDLAGVGVGGSSGRGRTQLGPPLPMQQVLSSKAPGVAEVLGGGTPRGAYAGCAAKSLLLAGTKLRTAGFTNVANIAGTEKHSPGRGLLGSRGG